MRNCLITGGTGTFGISYTINAILKKWHDKIIIYSRDEFKQINMFNMLCDKFSRFVQYKNVSTLSLRINGTNIRFFIGDVQNKERLLVATKNVNLVIHAAALKHVPICEYNPIEATSININGTINVASACGENGVRKVIALGTDKSVDPINIYGATKLCLEKVLLGSSRYYTETNYCVVRYGNIIGSRGSIIFSLMNKSQNKFYITNPEMTRFWLTIDEAVNLVRLAIANADSGDIFVPNLKSLTLAKTFEYLRPDVVPETIGIRAGEKMHEKMINDYDINRTYFVTINGNSISVDPELRTKSYLVIRDCVPRLNNHYEKFSIPSYTSDNVKRFEKEEFVNLCKGSIINKIYDDRGFSSDE